MKFEDYVKRGIRKGRSFFQVLAETYRGVEEGKIVLKDPSPPKTFIEYLARPAYSLWFYTAVSLLVGALLTVWITDLLPWLKPVRYVLGSIYVLFLPGYSVVEALYPGRNELTPLERLALSIGLSLAIVPLIGLVLNYTPWGIRLKPYIVISSTLIVVLLLIAAYRRFTLVRQHYTLRGE